MAPQCGDKNSFNNAAVVPQVRRRGWHSQPYFKKIYSRQRRVLHRYSFFPPMGKFPNPMPNFKTMLAETKLNQ
jgi:hypothetical protein